MIDPIIERVIALFTASEWKAIILLMLCTMALTQTVKVFWRRSPIKGGGNIGVNAIAAITGLASAYMVWPSVTTIPWYAAGIIAGPASIVMFKIWFGLLTKFFPTAAGILNSDRRKSTESPPPNDVERRKTDDQ